MNLGQVFTASATNARRQGFSFCLLPIIPKNIWRFGKEIVTLQKFLPKQN